jgi:hypothetical protein
VGHRQRQGLAAGWATARQLNSVRCIPAQPGGSVVGRVPTTGNLPRCVALVVVDAWVVIPIRWTAWRGMSRVPALMLVLACLLLSPRAALASPGAVAGAPFEPEAGNPAAAVNPANDHKYVLWQDENGHITTWYDGSWHGPLEMSWVATSSPAVAVGDSGDEYAFWRGRDGRIWTASNVNGRWTAAADLGWPSSSAPDALGSSVGHRWAPPGGRALRHPPEPALSARSARPGCRGRRSARRLPRRRLRSNPTEAANQ